MEWKDRSSYSKNDKERIPNNWGCSAGGISIAIHRNIYHPPETWLLTCEPFFRQKVLPETNIDKCKEIALQMVGEKLREAANAFSR